MLLPKQTCGAHYYSDMLMVRQLVADDIVPSGACGTGWNEPWVRDSYGKADFTNACRKHDQCYDTCGLSKDQCDGDFHGALKDECRNAYSGRFEVVQRSACLAIADAYHSAVHRLGGDAYRAAQRESNCPR